MVHQFHLYLRAEEMNFSWVQSLQVIWIPTYSSDVFAQNVSVPFTQWAAHKYKTLRMDLFLILIDTAKDYGD